MKIVKKFNYKFYTIEKISNSSLNFIRSHKSITSSNENNINKLNLSDHYPVLYKKIIDIIRDNIIINNKQDKPFLCGDVTVGLGNHSNLILKHFENSNILGFDIDPEMISKSKEKLNIYIKDKRAIVVKESYTESRIVLNNILASAKSISSKPFNGKFNKNKKFDYVIIDLGFNSVQLIDDNRGFSFKSHDSKLDMRYDFSNVNTATAAEILNNATELELILMFEKYAEEKYSETLVKNILEYRNENKFNLVKDFNEVIDKSFPNHTNKDRYNTYSRLYQALRICVNYELLNLQRFLENIPLSMEKNSLLFVICFHSLEFKAVKKSLKFYEKIKLGKIIYKNISADQDELSENSRSKSAIMMVFQFNENI